MVNFQVICKDNESCANLGEEIHDRLVGCKDYVESNIVLNMDGNILNLIVDMAHSDTMPVLTFHHRAPRYGAYEICIHHYEEKTDNPDVAATDMDPWITTDMLRDGIELYNTFPDTGWEVATKPSEKDEDEKRDWGKQHWVSYLKVPETILTDFDINFVSKDIKFHRGFISSVIK